MPLQRHFTALHFGFLFSVRMYSSHLGKFILKEEFHFLKTTKKSLVLMRYTAFGAYVRTKEALNQLTH